MPNTRGANNADRGEVGDDVRPNKRSRILSKACEGCKTKKSRCDSVRPQCDSCRRKGVTCIYKEKGQPGLRPGYGKAVEQRLSLLEDNMNDMARSIQSLLGHLQGQQATHVSPIQPVEPQTALGQPDVRPAESDDFWQTPAEEQPMQQACSFTESPALDLPGISGNIDSRLPPESVMVELIDIFFDHIHPWAPLFHKPTFVANMYTPGRHILLHGMVVLAFRFWTKTEPSVESRQAFVKTSRDQILLQTIDSCSLTSTQGLALLVIDALGQGPGPRTWNLMAMLVASSQQLGLARSSQSQPNTKSSLVDNEDPDGDLSFSSVEAEEKRRLFWTIYSLDRFSSVPHGQPSAIDSKSIRLPYPSSDDDWGQTSALEWFPGPSSSAQSRHAHYPPNLWHQNIDLLTLVDRSNQLLVQPVNLSLPAHCQEWQSSFRRLDTTLSTWFENLPREIREPPAVFDPMWTMIHATFHLINIRMYTVAAFPSTTSPYLRPSSSARGCCRHAIRNVASLTTSVQPHELAQLGPMFAFVVWVAARSLIILWTSGYETTYGAMPADLDALLSSLRSSTTYWPCAQRYVDIIQLILDTRNDPGGPTGLDIFNDTRRTAYGLQSRLGSLTGHRALSQIFPTSDDFLDVPLLDMDVSMPRLAATSGFSPDFDGEWL